MMIVNILPSHALYWQVFAIFCALLYFYCRFLVYFYCKRLQRVLHGMLDRATIFCMVLRCSKVCLPPESGHYTATLQRSAISQKRTSTANGSYLATGIGGFVQQMGTTDKSACLIT